MYTIKGTNKDNETILVENFSDDINIATNKAKELYQTNGLMNLCLIDSNGVSTIIDPTTFNMNVLPQNNQVLLNQQVGTTPPVTNSVDLSKVQGLQEIDPYAEIDIDVMPETTITNTGMQVAQSQQPILVKSSFENAPPPTPIKKLTVDIGDELAELERMNDTNFDTTTPISTKKEINPFDISIDEVQPTNNEEDKSFNIDKEFKEIGKVITYKDNIYIEDENGILREINMYKESKEMKTKNKPLKENYATEGADEVEHWVFTIHCKDKDSDEDIEYHLNDIPNSVKEQLADLLFDENETNELIVNVEDNFLPDSEDDDKEVLDYEEDKDYYYIDDYIKSVEHDRDDYEFEDNFSEEDILDEINSIDETEDNEYNEEETLTESYNTKKSTDSSNSLLERYIKTFVNEEKGNYLLPDELELMFEDLKEELIGNELLSQNDSQKEMIIYRQFRENLR